MVHDAVRVLSTVMKELHATSEISPVTVKCNALTGDWQQGQEIINAINQVNKFLSRKGCLNIQFQFRKQNTV